MVMPVNKAFRPPPLSFSGNKRFWAGELYDEAALLPAGATVWDCFGGSGVCARCVKDARPDCRVVWNDYVDLSCDELWENGVEVKTPFDGLMSMNDATTIWGLNESTLRKAISYGKLKNGIDVCKYGKQWVVSIEAMNREYGQPKQG